MSFNAFPVLRIIYIARMLIYEYRAHDESMGDLLAGLYGVFRNRVAHLDEELSWAEADAVI